MKAFLWIKHHWKALVVCFVFGVVYFLLRKQKYFAKLLEAWNFAEESYKKEIKIKEEAVLHKEEVEKRITQKYETSIKNLGKEESHEREKLNKKRGISIKEYVKAFEEEKELKKLLKEKHGFEEVE